jgi:hypothetical protein
MVARWLQNAVRVFAMVIALVLCPAQTANCEYSASDTIVLVLGAATPEPQTKPTPVEAAHRTQNRSVQPLLPWQVLVSSVRRAGNDPVRAFDRYLMNCSLLC